MAYEFFVRRDGRNRRFTGGKLRFLQEADGGKGATSAAAELCGIALGQSYTNAAVQCRVNFSPAATAEIKGRHRWRRRRMNQHFLKAIPENDACARRGRVRRTEPERRLHSGTMESGQGVVAPSIQSFLTACTSKMAFFSVQTPKMRSIRQENARNFVRNSVFRSPPPPLTNREGLSAIRGPIRGPALSQV